MHTSHTVPCTVFMVLALAVETLDRTIHRINDYPADKYYKLFEQLGPDG